MPFCLAFCPLSLTEMTCTGTINLKELDTLGGKKQLVGKTIFRLAPFFEGEPEIDTARN